MNYELNLTEEEVNKILNALSFCPYVEVFELIDKIKNQCVQTERKQEK